MKTAIACAFLVIAPLFASAADDSTTATIGAKAWACVSKEDFENSVDYSIHKEKALFEQMFLSKNAPCQPLNEGETVAVRSRSMWSVAIRRQGQTTLLYTNSGAFKK